MRRGGKQAKSPGKTPRHQVRISGIRAVGAGSRVRGRRADIRCGPQRPFSYTKGDQEEKASLIYKLNALPFAGDFEPRPGAGKHTEVEHSSILPIHGEALDSISGLFLLDLPFVSKRAAAARICWPGIRSRDFLILRLTHVFHLSYLGVLVFCLDLFMRAPQFVA